MTGEFNLSDYEDFLDAIESEETAEVSPGDADIGSLGESTSSAGVASQSSGTQAKVSTKKARMVYPEKIFEVSRVPTISLFKKTLESVETEEVFKILSPVASQVKQLAGNLFQQLQSSAVQAFSSAIVSGIWDLIKPLQGMSWSEKTRFEMWQRFHSYRGSEEVVNKWQCLLKDAEQWNDSAAEIVLLQYILKKIHQLLLFELMEADMPQEEAEDTALILEPHEEQALRYCAGYVPFKLIKRYRKVGKSETADKFVNVLSTWAHVPDREDTGFLTYTEDWISAQNRGGLFTINDETFRFFRCMEKVTQMTLKSKNLTTLQQVNVKGLLMGKIHRDKYVQNMWNKICTDLSPELKSKLFEEVMKCFVTMRVSAYLRVIQMVEKGKKGAISKKGAKSLRKELSTH